MGPKGAGDGGARGTGAVGQHTRLQGAVAPKADLKARLETGTQNWKLGQSTNVSRRVVDSGPEVDPAVAAKAFADQRTPEAFRAWAEASPAGAALWLQRVATAAGNPEAAAQLGAIMQNAPREKVSDIAALYGRVHAMKLGTDEPAGAAQNQWQTWDPNLKSMDPPSFTGKVSLENGQPMLTTPFGRFNVANQSNFEGSHTLGGLDVSAFNGRTVTVRGWPDKDWKPGGPGSIAIEEFAPGTSSEFTAGRVQSDGTNVFVQVRADKIVKVTDPQMAAALLRQDKLGIVLPGSAKKEGEQWVYDGKPADYYILGGFNMAEADPPRVGDHVNFTLQAAHGQAQPAELPIESWNQPHTQRHYFLGHFADGKFISQGMTPTAGGFTMQGVRSRPSIEFIERAIPVVPEVFSANDAKFGL